MLPPSKVVIYDHHGPPDSVTRVIELPPVQVKEVDVCVKMLATPINPTDSNRIEGIMEATICDVNHLDADVLLPPQKRLLARLKKQGLEADGTLD